MSKLLKQLNDNQNKVADTNGIMKLQAWDHSVAKDLTNKQITATVANASGFLFDIDIPSNGTEIDLDFKDSQLQKLTPDTYFLEIKVTDKDGDVSVFPTEGYATFTINKNLHATEGALVPQITFDTVLADVKTAMDKTVSEYVKTIAKGDKGDKGDPGKDGKDGKDAEMPVVGGRNYIPNSDFKIVQSNDVPYPNKTNLGTTVNGSEFSHKMVTTSLYVDIKNITSFSNGFNRVLMELIFFDVDGNKIYASPSTNITQSYLKVGDSFSGRITAFKDLTNVNIDPDRGVSAGVYIQGIKADYIEASRPKLELGTIATDWTPAPEDVQSDINKRAIDTSVVHNTGDETVAGNNMYVGDNTYMGTNTFIDGITLAGKNKVNDITDTDWLDIPLAEGRTGTAKYKVSLGKVFVHLDGVKGVTATGNNAQGQIGTLPVNPSPYYSRYTVQSGSKVMGLTIAANGTIYIANSMGNPMTEDDPYFFDTVLM